MTHGGYDAPELIIDSAVHSCENRIFVVLLSLTIRHIHIRDREGRGKRKRIRKEKKREEENLF
jgi:hypothetical protein